MPDTLFHGRYRIVRCLKQGGMGAVYEVGDEKTSSRRALKVMLPGIVKDHDLRARFELEARVTGSVESDHIVRVSDAGVDAATETPFLVMDLLRGEDLGSVLEQRGKLGADEVVLYLSQAGRALDKTHAAGVIHRDLKPENLFLTTRDDGTPCVKILDFGIAKVIEESTQGNGTRSMGTPKYMAPEQIRGLGGLGPGVDVYALGHIAYTLLVGEEYWHEEATALRSMFGFFQRVVEGMPEAPTARARRTHGVTLPEGFDVWLQQATAERPADRFASAGKAVLALAATLGREGLLLPSTRALAGLDASGAKEREARTEISTAPTLAQSGPSGALAAGDLDAPQTVLDPASAPPRADEGAQVEGRSRAVTPQPPRRAPVVIGALVGALCMGGALLVWASREPAREPAASALPAASAVAAATPSSSAPAPLASAAPEPSVTPAPASSAGAAPPPAVIAAPTARRAPAPPPTTRPSAPPPAAHGLL
jgi:serine/threonine-protein kinase